MKNSSEQIKKFATWILALGLLGSIILGILGIFIAIGIGFAITIVSVFVTFSSYYFFIGLSELLEITAKISDTICKNEAKSKCEMCGEEADKLHLAKAGEKNIHICEECFQRALKMQNPVEQIKKVSVDNKSND